MNFQVFVNLKYAAELEGFPTLAVSYCLVNAKSYEQRSPYKLERELLLQHLLKDSFWLLKL